MTKNKKIELPALSETNGEDILNSITTSLGFPREILASNEDIEAVWTTLKPELSKVKEEYRYEMLARMVVAIRVGLFSSAVNEMWNTAISVLSEKIREFGLDIASQFLTYDLDEKKFKELKDSELLDICVELGLINEDSYFFLSHCRDIRNNYSSAHPSNNMLDGPELNYFIHQCVKHVLSSDVSFVGFRSDDFFKAIKASKLDDETLEELSEKIRKTNALQKTAFLKALFANYVDEQNDEFIRQNCLDLSRYNWSDFPEEAKSEIIVLYSNYVIQDTTKKQYAKQYFEKVEALDLLPNSEQVSIVYKVIKQLESAHFDINNFFNEKPFAERLANLKKSIPKQIKKEFVYIVTLCYVGNQFGTSYSSESFYIDIIKNFTVREIDKIFTLIDEENYLNYRIKKFKRCKDKFKDLLALLNEESVPSKWKDKYSKLVKK